MSIYMGGIFGTHDKVRVTYRIVGDEVIYICFYGGLPLVWFAEKDEEILLLSICLHRVNPWIEIGINALEDRAEFSAEFEGSGEVYDQIKSKIEQIIRKLNAQGKLDAQTQINEITGKVRRWEII